MAKTKSQLARKRFARENRADKGQAAEARRQAHNALVRKARSRFGIADESDLLFAYSLLKRG